MRSSDLFDLIEDNSIDIDFTIQVNTDRIREMTMKRIVGHEEKRETRRIGARFLLAAVIASVLLGTTVFAAEITRFYDSPAEFLHMVFGSDSVETDPAKTVVQSLPEKEVEITIPGSQRVPLDEAAAEEVSGMVAEIIGSVTQNGKTLSVLANCYDPATDIGFLYYILEDSAGVGGYSLAENGEILWDGAQAVRHSVLGKSYCIREETDTNKLTAVLHYQTLGSEEKILSIGLAEDETERIFVEIPEVVHESLKSSTDGSILLSPMGIRLCLDEMYWLGIVDTDGSYVPPRDSNRIKNLELEYLDGSVFTVLQAGDLDNTVLGYSVGFMPTYAVYAFNRLVSVTEVEAVRINGVRYQMRKPGQLSVSEPVLVCGGSGEFLEAACATDKEMKVEAGAIAEGILKHRILGVRVVTDVNDLPGGKFRQDSYVSVYTRRGEKIHYAYPAYLLENGELPGGVHMILVDIEVTSEGAKNWTVDTWPRGLYEDPYIFRIDGAYMLREKDADDGLFGYTMDYFSAAGEAEEHPFAYRIEPGQTRYFTVGFLIGGDPDGSILSAEAFSIRVPYGNRDADGQWVRKEQLFPIESNR